MEPLQGSLVGTEGEGPPQQVVTQAHFIVRHSFSVVLYLVSFSENLRRGTAPSDQLPAPAGTKPLQALCPTHESVVEGQWQVGGVEEWFPAESPFTLPITATGITRSTGQDLWHLYW